MKKFHCNKNKCVFILIIFCLLSFMTSLINKDLTLKIKSKVNQEPFHLRHVWFVKGGKIRPIPAEIDEVSGSPVTHLWPDEDPGDRIIEQLMFVPSNFTRITTNGSRLKTILLYNGIYSWSPIPLTEGRTFFIKSQCPVDTCSITFNGSKSSEVDAIIFKNGLTGPISHRPTNQVWILYLLESPFHSRSFKNHSKVFNWTSTYRHDSDVPAVYSKFILYNPNVMSLPLSKNYARNRTRKIAWFVSNCFAPNNRLKYAQNLSEYINVDIYGKCGPIECPLSQKNYCQDKIRSEYKFYMAFENSNCRDYITEKFFLNALSNDLLPIVMGAAKKDYERVAPHNSFIHVDDFESPKHLAEYLHILDKNDTLYNEYFKWKGTGEILHNDFYMCRVCAMLHAKQRIKVYEDMEKWWRKPGICVKGSWKKNESVYR